MTTLITIYIFMAIATTLAWCDNFRFTEVVAYALLGATWPLFLTVKTLQKLFR